MSENVLVWLKRRRRWNPLEAYRSNFLNFPAEGRKKVSCSDLKRKEKKESDAILAEKDADFYEHERQLLMIKNTYF